MTPVRPLRQRLTSRYASLSGRMSSSESWHFFLFVLSVLGMFVLAYAAFHPSVVLLTLVSVQILLLTTIAMTVGRPYDGDPRKVIKTGDLTWVRSSRSDRTDSGDK